MCRSKHVKQLINIGIINSTTRSHLVGYFYAIYIEFCFTGRTVVDGRNNMQFLNFTVSVFCKGRDELLLGWYHLPKFVIFSFVVTKHNMT